MASIEIVSQFGRFFSCPLTPIRPIVQKLAYIFTQIAIAVARGANKYYYGILFNAGVRVKHVVFSKSPGWNTEFSGIVTCKFVPFQQSQLN